MMRAWSSKRVFAATACSGLAAFACGDASAPPTPAFAYDYVIREAGAQDQIVRGDSADATIRTQSAEGQPIYLLRLTLGDSLFLHQWTRDDRTIVPGTYALKLGTLWPDSSFALGTKHRRLNGEFRLDLMASSVTLETVSADSVRGHFRIVLQDSPVYMLRATTAEGRFAVRRGVP